MRLLRRCVFGLLVLCFGYMAAAFVGALVPGQISADDSPKTETIILVSGPIHYDILIPLTPDTRTAFGFLEEMGQPVSHPNARWLVVGWGSRAFYTATGGYGDLDIATIWTAVTGDTSVLRFEVLGEITADDSWPQIAVSDRQLAALRGAILQAFNRNSEGAVQSVPGAHLTERDIFFEANGHFSILRTCNVWISATLRDAGIQMGLWTPTPFAVTLSHRWFGQS